VRGEEAVGGVEAAGRDSGLESTDASVRAPVITDVAVSGEDGLGGARIEGNEKGVQLPVANDRSKTVPSAARSESTGNIDRCRRDRSRPPGANRS